ncbi:ribosome biogenesis GTPase [Pseudoalteromonas citrea]|uniref:Small ribosomal subunit biogenesis GTPase RsgA n=2 Tax=Pseudoalteromonas citrea TaxID=43655 RepID=A0AAD4FR60_9GAMM|nr:ribosome small subunit-dependent GTPase A [Pseudoalteromonas citrea]KAF7768873.1 ribosome biogenesis GTPase [Pseudoalteromonas citrea]
MSYSELNKLGWSNLFFQQLSYDEICDENICNLVYRISEIHRSRIVGRGLAGEQSIICGSEYQPISQHLAVGDWVLAELANEHYRITKIFTPKNRVRRISNGLPQVIAANLDYLWIVTSANEEFNVKRLERYISLAYEFDITPIVVLTKLDLCDDIEQFTSQIKHLDVPNVHALSSNQPSSLGVLQAYLYEGSSIALVGSSGVGKSTLINALFHTRQATKEVRESDDHGKHTTTHRQLFFTDGDVAVIDTPGMRELQLYNAEQGIERTFSSIIELVTECKYSDCTHSNEPGCAVQAAIAEGLISEAHFANYLKLLKEEESQQRRTVGAHAVKEHYRAYFKKIHSDNKEKW